MTTRLTTRALERIVRGFSCHRRIQILDLLVSNPEPLSLTDISRLCRTDIKPISEHVGRLHAAGLVAKRNKGRRVMHDSTAMGDQVMAFLRTLGRSES